MHECQIPAQVGLAEGPPKIEVFHHNEGPTAIACRHTERGLLVQSPTVQQARPSGGAAASLHL